MERSCGRLVGGEIMWQNGGGELQQWERDESAKTQTQAEAGGRGRGGGGERNCVSFRERGVENRRRVTARPVDERSHTPFAAARVHAARLAPRRLRACLGARSFSLR
eukprot:6199037-Pleurochrysis_carterae.AAC.2